MTLPALKPAEEIWRAAETLHRIATRASGTDWLPATEALPEDVVTHGVVDTGTDDLIVGGCSDCWITDEDALYVSLVSPVVAEPIVEGLREAARWLKDNEGFDLDTLPILAPSLKLARTINSRYLAIKATEIHEPRY